MPTERGNNFCSALLRSSSTWIISTCLPCAIYAPLTLNSGIPGKIIYCLSSIIKQHRHSKPVWITPAQRHIVAQENRTSATRMLGKFGIVTEVLTELWETFSDDYFIYHSPDEISWHSQILLDSPEINTKINARINQRDEAEIFIYSEESENLFAKIVSTIEQLGLNIADAKINVTDDNFALNSFKVLEENGCSPTEDYRIAEIIEKLSTRILDPDNLISPSTRKPSRTHKIFDVETVIRFDQKVGNDLTVLNIIARDKPGLLASIAQAFVECHIHIHHAKISTAGEKALDSFHITDKDHNPLLDDKPIEELKAALLSQLGN